MEVVKNSLTFAQAVRKVQMAVGVVGKNTDGYNYRYADLPKLWQAVVPFMDVYGLTMTIEEILPSEDGRWLITKARIEHDDSGESRVAKISADARAFNSKNKEGMTVQDTGSLTTYMRRYVMAVYFNIPIADEDDDARLVTERQLEQLEQQAKYKSDLKRLANGLNTQFKGDSTAVKNWIEQTLGRANIKTLKDLEHDEVVKLLEELE